MHRVSFNSRQREIYTLLYSTIFLLFHLISLFPYFSFVYLHRSLYHPTHVSSRDGFGVLLNIQSHYPDTEPSNNAFVIRAINQTSSDLHDTVYDTKERMHDSHEQSRGCVHRAKVAALTRVKKSREAGRIPDGLWLEHGDHGGTLRR